MTQLDPEFVPDWTERRARYEAWWEGRLLDRPPVYLTVRRHSPRWAPTPLPELHGDFQRQLVDVDVIVATMERELATTDYLADAFPLWQRGLNTATIAAFCGAALEFGDETVWVHPTVLDWTEEPLPRFEPEHPMHRQWVSVAEAVAERAQGRWIAAIPDLLDAGSTMLQLRGPEAFLMDLIEGAPGLFEYRDALAQVWRDAFAWWRDRDTASGCEGHTGWWRLFTSQTYGLVQSDVCALLSPSLFEQLSLPELAETSKWLGRSIYHLDGQAELAHLDAILSLPHITAIQWQPGDGQPTCSNWIPLLRKIQAHGKGLQLFCWRSDLEAITRELRPEGVMLWFFDPMTQDQAQHVLADVHRWSMKRH